MTTYQEYEASAALGHPIELYDIAMGTTHWYLTTTDADTVYGINTYLPEVCQCSAVKKTTNYPEDAVELKIPRGHEIATMIVAGTPELLMSLTKYRGHEGSYIKEFTGYLTNFKFDSDSVPTLIFEPSSSDMQTIGGRRKIMKLCSHRLYGYRCGVNKTSYEISGTIDKISGIDIEATEFGAVAVDSPDIYGDLTGIDGCVYSATSSLSLGPASYAFNNITGYVKDKASRTSFLSHPVSIIPYNSWASASKTNQKIICKWTTKQKIKKIRLYLLSYKGEFRLENPKYIRVIGSNNGSDWTTIPVADWSDGCILYNGEGGSDTEILASSSGSVVMTLDGENEYYYYGLHVYSSHATNRLIAISEIEMIEADGAMDFNQFGAGGEIIVGISHRTIVAHNGNKITIDRPFPSNVTAGVSFTAYAGCNHTRECCRELFNNTINYGGLWNLPIKNPYVGRNSLVS